MQSILLRLVFFLASFSFTLGASIAAMEDGFAIGLNQLVEVPAVCWLLAFGTGCMGAIDRKVITRAGQKPSP